jgi:AraC-like DNA-binding protein
MKFEAWREYSDLWSKEIAFLPLARISDPERERVALTYRIPLSVGIASPRAVLLVLIPRASIDAYFQDVLRLGGWVRMVDGSGRVLYDSSLRSIEGVFDRTISDREPANTETDRRLVFSVYSRVSHVRFDAFLPRSFVTKSTAPVTALYVAVLVGTIVVALGSAGFFALRQSKPISHIFGMVADSSDRIHGTSGAGDQGRGHERGSPPVRFDYSWLEAELEELIGQRFSVEQALHQQSKMLRGGFFERLLRGGFDSEEEILDGLVHVNIEFADPPWIVAVLNVQEIDTTEDRAVADAVLHGYFRKRAEGGRHAHRDADGTILVMPNGEVPALHAELEALQVRFGLKVLVALGSAVSRLVEVSQSFNEAIATRRVTPRAGTYPQFAYFDSVHANATPASYDPADGRRLANAALSGDETGVTDLLEEMRRANFEGSLPSTTALECLLSDVTAVIIRIVQESGLAASAGPASGTGPGNSTPPAAAPGAGAVTPPDAAPDAPAPSEQASAAGPGNSTPPADRPRLPANYVRYLESYASPADFFDRAARVLYPVCKTAEANKQSHNSKRIRQILDYLGDSYRDPMLCLASVSARFELNPQYFSRYFKEQVGQPFSAYLETQRLSRATELMMGSDRPLQDIATEVGYLSWNSFYKAFRRSYGVSPGQYRGAHSEDAARAVQAAGTGDPTKPAREATGL